MTVAVGFFDGVHLGHREILRGADAALTFRNHPLSVLAPDKAPRLLMSPEAKVASIRALGVREVVALDFTPDFAALTPDDFISFLLDRFSRGQSPSDSSIRRFVDSSICRIVESPNPQIFESKNRGIDESTNFSLNLRAGANWRFGRGGIGDAEFLRSRGIPIEIVPYAEYRGEPISSTRIRRALAAGALADAAAMLGRPVTLSGRVASGKHLGRELGFPTVNIVPDSAPELPLGVYSARLAGVRAIANYGFAPTTGSRAWTSPVLELHFLEPGFPETFAGTVPVELVSFLRPERKFASLDDLRAQIARDIGMVI